MSVEILTVSLSEDSVAAIANRVAQLVGGMQTTTQSNPPSSQTPQDAARPASGASDDPWENATPTPPAQQQAQGQPGQPEQKFCAHGQMKYFPPGYSQSKQKPYGASYRCPAPRGPGQCQAVWMS